MQKQRIMQLNKIFKRATEFIVKSIRFPRAFWSDIAERKATIAVFSHVYLPLLIICVLAGMVGEFFSNPEALLFYSLLYAARQFIVFVFCFYLSVWISHNLFVRMGGGQESLKIMKLLIGFSFVPVLLVLTITGLFPFLHPLNIFVFYGIYIFICGVSILFELPENRLKVFIILAVLVNLATFAILKITFTKVFDLFY